MHNRTKIFRKQFSKIKPKIYKRDKWECILKNKNCLGSLAVHHIIPRSLLGNNEQSNLITLCWWHHMRVEEGTKDEKEKCYRIFSKHIKKYKVGINKG